MHSYIIIHHTPQTFEMALFINNTIVNHHVHDKRLTSKMLIPLFNEMLANHNMTLMSLSFIGINQGPGMFSTLRSVIATVNGLHCAMSIPLIGIDALYATTCEFFIPFAPYTATLLNACNNEVYYALSDNKKILTSGYSTLKPLLLKIEQLFPHKTVHFIGDGIITNLDVIKGYTAIDAFITDPIPSLCSINMIGQLAVEKYINNEYGSYLFPLHLKKHAVELR